LAGIAPLPLVTEATRAALPVAIRGAVALVGAGYVTIIAVATVWAEWHRPSDTIAALLIVLAWAGLAAFLVRLRRLVPERPSRPATVLLLASGAVTGAAGLLGLGAFGTLTATLVQALGRGRPGRGAFLVTLLYGGAAAALGLQAREQLRQVAPEAIQEVQGDLQAAAEGVRSGT